MASLDDVIEDKLDSFSIECPYVFIGIDIGQKHCYGQVLIMNVLHCANKIPLFRTTLPLPPPPWIKFMTSPQTPSPSAHAQEVYDAVMNTRMKLGVASHQFIVAVERQHGSATNIRVEQAIRSYLEAKDITVCVINPRRWKKEVGLIAFMKNECDGWRNTWWWQKKASIAYYNHQYNTHGDATPSSWWSEHRPRTHDECDAFWIASAITNIMSNTCQKRMNCLTFSN